MLTCSEDDYLKLATLRPISQIKFGMKSGINWAKTYNGWYLDGGMFVSQVAPASSLTRQEDGRRQNQ